jgi:hypothetical protein
VRLATRAEMCARASTARARVVLCGHSHMARIVGARSTAAGGQSGSVGLPAYTDSAPVRHSMQMGAPHARYAVLERKKASGPVAGHVPRRRL